MYTVRIYATEFAPIRIEDLKHSHRGNDLNSKIFSLVVCQMKVLYTKANLFDRLFRYKVKNRQIMNLKDAENAYTLKRGKLTMYTFHRDVWPNNP